jgi:hypothetical protein
LDWQYLDASHTLKSLAPLLALQDKQHSEIVVWVMMFSSLMMCSQEGFSPLVRAATEKSRWQ